MQIGQRVGDLGDDLEFDTESAEVRTTWRFDCSTRVVFESEWEMPGKIPGAIKDLATKGWMERNTRNIVADFKTLAEEDED